MMRRVPLAALATIGAFACNCASALAATTRVVAPEAARQANPCTTATPCDYYWAITHSSSGDTVAFESGEYDYDGSVHTSALVVSSGVTLGPAPGDATRPVIKQTVAYASSNAPTLVLDGSTLEGLEVDQAAGAVGHAAGAIEMGAGDVVERAELIGRRNGMYFAGPAGSAELKDSLVVANSGVAVEVQNGGWDPMLDNVTAIAHGTASGEGVALEVAGFGPASTQLNATNTIARGDVYDALVDATTATSTIVLSYSDARTAMEHTQSGSGTATLLDTNPMHADPVFVSSTDYDEAESSPTIDAGTADPASGSLDFNGLPRTIGPATDIGATEFQGAFPTATTGIASATGQSTATLTGAVAPEDLLTSWYFNYGTTTAYGSTSPVGTLGAVLASQPVSAALSGLAPGTTYHFQLVASNVLGPSPGGDGTFTTAPAPPRDTTPPSVSSLEVSPSTFAVAKGPTAVLASARRHRGTRIEFKLSETAKVVIAFARKRTGIKLGKSCFAPSRKHRHGEACTRYLPAGSLVRRSEPAGAVGIAFTGRLGRKALSPGRYRLTLTATDPSGNASKQSTATFTIVNR